MRSSMATRLTIFLISAVILMGLIAPNTHAAVTIDVGDYRALAHQFVKEKFDLSDDAARTVMHQYEVMHNSRVMDTLELPDGAVLDFVTVGGQSEDPDSIVTFEGSGVLRQAHPRLMGRAISEILEEATPEERRHLLEGIAQARERGWFVQEITEEQRKNLLDYRLPGDEGTMRPAQARSVRILVVLNNFPHWDDRAPTRNSYDQPQSHARPGPREHPMHAEDITSNLYTPGGPLSTDDFEPAGLGDWDHSGINPDSGNHPRIQYNVDGHPGTSVALRERWFELLFSQSNPSSVTNYYWANSNGNLRIQGNRSDIRGPLDSRHILDRFPADSEAYDYAVQPGTPIIERVPEPPSPPYGIPNLRGISADSGHNIVGTLGYVGRVYISGVDLWDEDDGVWGPRDIDQRSPDPYDRRRYIVETEGFDSDERIRVRMSGGSLVAPGGFAINGGWSLNRDQSRTTFRTEDVLGSEEGNRLLSMCYYTHDHTARDGQMGSRPYQLAHLRNTAGRIDDICGTVDHADHRMRRPFPYDHDISDHSAPNAGMFSEGMMHTYRGWMMHLAEVMRDENIPATYAGGSIHTEGYDTTICLYPSGTHEGGSSPWSGGHVFIPNATPNGTVRLPEDAGLTLAAHELGHALMGWPDLYDGDFYVNAYGRVPPKVESNMMGPYSLMARGVRVDAFLKIMAGWATPIAVTEDMIRAEVPEIEGTLQDPVVYKLPGRPHYIAQDIKPDQWQEYFLVSNRNRTGGDYFGDRSPRGMYIYHVDQRVEPNQRGQKQHDEDQPWVIIEQADGLYELTTKLDGNPGDLQGDPFPGSHDVRDFTQYTTPSSNSYGFMRDFSQTNQMNTSADLREGTQTDSFTRVTNISDPGQLMTADIHVKPREIIVTEIPIDRGLAPGEELTVPQGTEDFLVQRLHLHNDGNLPNFSMGDVELASVRIDESGSSQRDADIDRTSLFDDTNGNGEFDVDVDTRIGTATFQNQSAFFTNLNYRVPLNEERDLFVTYDISPGANTGEGNSIGAAIERHDYIRPEVPGAVQDRRRTAMSDSDAGLAEHRFPITSQRADIIEEPDTLTVTGVSRAPVSTQAAQIQPADVTPGQTDVPILSLECEVDHDSVDINTLSVDETGNMNAVAHITSAKLFVDENQDGAVDGNDTLVEETTFANENGTQQATFDFASEPVAVTESGMVSLLLTASFSDELPLADPPLTMQYTLEDPSYIGLVQSVDVVSAENFPISSETVTTPDRGDPPQPPLNLTATVLDDGEVRLGWELSEDDADKQDADGEDDVVEYHIYRSTDPADFDTITVADALAVVSGGVSEYDDLEAPEDVPLYYMARAFDGAHESENSNIVGPIEARDDPPEPPLNVTGQPQPEGTVLLSWELSADDPNKPGASGENDVQGYRVYRADEAADLANIETGQAIATLNPGVTEYLDPRPPLNQDLFYMLRAFDASVESENSNVVGPLQAQDTVAPEFTLFEPEQDATNVPVDTNIAVEAVDERSGIDTENFVFEVDGTDVSADVNVAAAVRGTRLEYDPPEDFEMQQQVDVRVAVLDGEGNQTEAQYQFTTSGPPVHMVAGVITDRAGNPEEGVRVEAGSLSALTDENGAYMIEGLSEGTYTVKPTKDGRSFEPAQRTVTLPPDAVATDFTAMPGFDITGSVVTVAGEPLGGVTLTADAKTEVTGQDGLWAFEDVPAGTYTVIPDRSGRVFTPSEMEITVNADVGDSTDNEFVAAVKTYGVTGTIRTPGGDRLAGIEVRAVADDTVVSTGTSNDNGVYAVEGLTPGSYIIRPVNADYAFDPTERELEVATDIGDIDFIGAALHTVNVPAGLQMMGIPVSPIRPDAATVFGPDIPVARWDPQTAAYVEAPADNPVLEVAPGAGFWTNAENPVVLDVPGTLFSNDQDIVLPVQSIWNMLANPFHRSLPWEQMNLSADGPASTYGFIWDTDAGTYRLVSTLPGLGAVTVVPENAGFWLRTEATTNVTITAPGTEPASAEIAQQVKREPADDAWIIPIVARAAGALDACSYAGVLPQASTNPEAYRMHNPPAAGPQVDVYFVDDAGDRLAVVVRENRPVHTWHFEAATDIAGARVEVQMPDLSEVPNNKSVYLTDEAAGKRMYARTLTTYSYESGESGTRRFTLEVADRSETGLMITTASAQAAGGAVTVSYTLSADAQVNVEVLNIAGRKVATLASGESAPAGLSTCGWNGRSSSGTVVPSGRYLVRVKAQADDGQQVQALVPVQLER